jgi:hypothetical protein
MRAISIATFATTSIALHGALMLASLAALCAGCVQAKLASHDLDAALPIVLLLGSISQQQPALLSEYLPQLEECLGSFAGGWLCSAVGLPQTSDTSEHLNQTWLHHELISLCLINLKNYFTRGLACLVGVIKAGVLALASCSTWFHTNMAVLCCAVLCCPGLSSDTAMSLLLAVWPLCRVRSDLQDFVVMLLRKMMYRQDVDGRWAKLANSLAELPQQPIMAVFAAKTKHTPSQLGLHCCGSRARLQDT